MYMVWGRLLSCWAEAWSDSVKVPEASLWSRGAWFVGWSRPAMCLPHIHQLGVRMGKVPC